MVGSPEAAKLATLKEAARIGFMDIDEGGFHDVDANDLEDFITRLGRQASEQARESSSAPGSGADKTGNRSV